MRFGSVCSGIEAASVAFGPLGWKAAWFSEIEPFPCAVLAHHYQHVPNLGDMTTIADRIEVGEVEAPDGLWGGTPCQAFSVAGLRRSLDDARGNLSLEFIRIADAIDRVRCRDGKPHAWIGWENVPGVLSTKDNAFGAFLGGLCGCDAALDAPPDGWPSAGVVAGPSRVVAWRVLDAQFFGVAQRRKRVFVLALGGPGAWACADALLPVSDRMRWHPAPSRETGQGVTGTLSARTEGGGGLGTDFDLAGGLQAFGGGNTGGGIDVSTCLTRHGVRLDFDSETFVTHSLRGEGLDASEDGTGRGTPLVPVSFAIQAGALRENPASGPDGVGVQADHAYTLEARAEVQAVAFAATDYESGAFDQVEQAAPLTTSADRTRAAPILAFSAKDHGGDAAEDLSPTLRAGGHSGSHANAGVMPAVAFAIGSHAGAADGDQTNRSHASGGPVGSNISEELAYSLRGGRTQNVGTAMQVRRLTPRECERLQGFPDDYTAVPHRGKPAADGPRYKALGNSWAVPCVRWIGRRINVIRASA